MKALVFSHLHVPRFVNTARYAPTMLFTNIRIEKAVCMTTKFPCGYKQARMSPGILAQE